MKKILLFSTLILNLQAKSQLPQLGKSSNNQVIAALTLEEKAQLVNGISVGGTDCTYTLLLKQTKESVPGAAGATAPIHRLGITPVVLADGPAGLRINTKRPNSKDTYYCTGFPVSTLLAATWNQELVQTVGAAMGNEVLEYGGDVLLAPGMNIHRNPLNGRNFEYYSEEPFLAGKTAAAFVRGVQSQGVGTSIKHFACNSQETNRGGNNAIVSQRALREIYLKNFEIAVKESNPWTVMTSYNKLNGRYTSEDPVLINTILRKEWGFKGMVMSDWAAGKNPTDQMLAGNDLLEPGRINDYKNILESLKSGKLPVSTIDSNINRVLELVKKTPRFNGYIPSNKPNLKAHALVTRQSATEGIILLKNNKEALPFNNSIHNVALFGVGSFDLFTAGGTGSGDVHKAYVVNLKQGLANANIHIEITMKTAYYNYFADSMPVVKKYNAKVKWDQSPYRLTEMIPSEADLKMSARNADIAILTIGRNSGEAHDRKIKYDFLFSNDETELLSKVCTAFHQSGKKVVVILNICGEIETASWKNLPDAILVAWQPGQEGGNSIVDILKGIENPSGKLPMTFPINYEDVPSAKNFPSEYATEVNKEKDKKTNVDFTNYEEGIYVGYRHYTTFNKPVSYPFGYGISYTNYSYSNLKVKIKEGMVVANITITNIGKVAGKEIAELNVTAPKGKLDKPQLELKAFAKTTLLKPGESQTLEMVFSKSDLSSYDEKASSWVTDKGDYSISIGASVNDIKTKAIITLDKKLEKKLECW